MTAHSFKEFQFDKDDQLYNTLKVMLEGHLQDLLNEFNLNFQFQTILSYALEDARIVKFPYLQYTIKYLSYEEAQFINTGNSIRVELYTYVTFTKVEDHSIVTARCDLIEFKNQQFTIGKFEIIKPETVSCVMDTLQNLPKNHVPFFTFNSSYVKKMQLFLSWIYSLLHT